MNKKQAIRDMIREYIKMDDSNPNKKEFKSFLIDEMKERYSMKDEPTQHLLESWMKNELRTELEEAFGLHQQPSTKGEVIATFKPLQNLD